MKAITAREAERLMDELGLDYGMDGTTYYAVNEERTEVYDFDSRKERDEFVKRCK